MAVNVKHLTSSDNVEIEVKAAEYANQAVSIVGHDLKGATGVTATAYPTDNEMIPKMSFLSYWNGAHSGSTVSNLAYCAQGTIIGSNNIGSQSVKHADNASVANLASKTICSLKFGSKTFNGVSDQTITAADLSTITLQLTDPADTSYILS